MDVPYVLLIVLLAVNVAKPQSSSCPRIVAQQGDPDDLDVSVVSVYLDPAGNPDLPQRVTLIRRGEVVSPLDSLDMLQFAVQVGLLAPLPTDLNDVVATMEITGNRSLHFAVSVWSMDSSVAPPGCPTPRIGTLTPEQNQAFSVSLGCSSQGTVFMQFCLTIGTEEFSLLNGTYQTFTLFFPRACLGPTQSQCDINTIAVLAEFCLTFNQTRALVDHGAGGWQFLLSIFSDQSFNSNETRGYCLVNTNENGNGVSRIVTDDATNRRFYIDEFFPSLELVISVKRTVTPDGAAFSYSMEFTSENTRILSNPTLSVPQQDTITEETLMELYLPCINPGFTLVNIEYNTSVFIDDILYGYDYNISFYRNCTPDSNSTHLIVKQANFGLTAGLPVALIILLLLVSIATVVIVMVLLTMRHRRRKYEVEQEIALAILPTSNAYLSTHFQDPLQFLEEYDIEYNYATLEVMDELGEGAFGQVYKAKAPGIHRGEYQPEDFIVAVKTLKNDSEGNLLEVFCSEVKICIKFEHVNVIRLLGVCTKSSQRCMIFEYMDHGSLGELLRLSDPENPNPPGPDSDELLITPQLFLSCLIQVASGLNYLAGLKFVHRDIATRNCLVNHNFIVKIADFGMSREVNTSDYYRIGSTKACLPVRWIPPEALLYGKFTVKSDVWSFGVLLWEVYTYAHQPYAGMSNYEVIDKIKEGGTLECPELCPASIYDIAKSCWTRVPSKRPHISTILSRLSHLARSSAVKRIGDDYTIMAPAEGYLNMTFGSVATQDEVREMKRVEAILEGGNEQQLGKKFREETKIEIIENEHVEETEDTSHVTVENEHVGETEDTSHVTVENEHVGETEDTSHVTVENEHVEETEDTSHVTVENDHVEETEKTSHVTKSNSHETVVQVTNEETHVTEELESSHVPTSTEYVNINDQLEVQERNHVTEEYVYSIDYVNIAKAENEDMTSSNSKRGEPSFPTDTPSEDTHQDESNNP